jgi:hypothetical protein
MKAKSETDVWFHLLEAQTPIVYHVLHALRLLVYKVEEQARGLGKAPL